MRVAEKTENFFYWSLEQKSVEDFWFATLGVPVYFHKPLGFT